MTEKLDWLRLWTDFPDDPKVQLLAFDDQRHYVVVLCLKRAGILDASYSSPELRERIIARKLGLAEDKAAECKRRLSEVDLIDASWNPLGWDRRQFASDSSGAERTRKWRERKAAEQGSDGLKRHSDVTVTPSDTDTDTDTDTDSESSVDTSSAPETVLALTPSPDGSGPAPSKRQTATRLPDPYPMTAEHRAIAEAEKLPDPEREFARFCDHWHAAGGQNARKHNWIATWRNWCRRAADTAAKAPGRRKTRYEEAIDHLREAQRNATR